MRELTLTEIDNVSGADLGSRLNAAIVGGVAAFFAGSVWGAARGGDGGGILGVGTIGQGVGMVYGSIVGAVGGAIARLRRPECHMLLHWWVYDALFNGTFAK